MSIATADNKITVIFLFTFIAFITSHITAFNYTMMNHFIQIFCYTTKVKICQDSSEIKDNPMIRALSLYERTPF